jgi:hypothetical protein
MHVAGPIALYLAAVALCAALALPLLRAAFGNGPRVPLFALALTVGYPLALVVFSLIAQAVPDYATALPASLVSLLAASWAVWRWQQEQGRRRRCMTAVATDCCSPDSGRRWWHRGWSARFGRPSPGTTPCPGPASRNCSTCR